MDRPLKDYVVSVALRGTRLSLRFYRLISCFLLTFTLDYLVVLLLSLKCYVKAQKETHTPAVMCFLRTRFISVFSQVGVIETSALKISVFLARPE